MPYKILIVEDEPDIVRLIQNRLNDEKFDVTIAMDGKEALDYIVNPEKPKHHPKIGTLEAI